MRAQRVQPLAPQITNNAIGRWSSLAVLVIGLAYIVALSIGFATRGLSAPIVDPLLAVMEVLTLIAAAFMLCMMAAIHERAPDKCKTMGTLAMAFMILMAGMTSAVHFVQLTAIRQAGTASLVWPSIPYAVELLAWDVFLGLSLVFAAFTFERTGREARVRHALMFCGVLCVVGIVGPMAGNMRLQLVGVFAYGIVLPVVAFLLWRLFVGDQGSAKVEAD